MNYDSNKSEEMNCHNNWMNEKIGKMVFNVYNPN